MSFYHLCSSESEYVILELQVFSFNNLTIMLDSGFYYYSWEVWCQSSFHLFKKLSVCVWLFLRYSFKIFKWFFMFTNSMLIFLSLLFCVILIVIHWDSWTWKLYFTNSEKFLVILLNIRSPPFCASASFLRHQ